MQKCDGGCILYLLAAALQSNSVKDSFAIHFLASPLKGHPPENEMIQFMASHSAKPLCQRLFFKDSVTAAGWAKPTWITKHA